MLGNIIDDKKLTYANCVWSSLTKKRKKWTHVPANCVVETLWYYELILVILMLETMLQQQTFSGWSKWNQTNFDLYTYIGTFNRTECRILNIKTKLAISYGFFSLSSWNSHDPHKNNIDHICKTEKQQRGKKTTQAIWLLPTETVEYW